MCLLSWAAPLHQATSQVVLLRYCHFSSVKSQLQRSQGFPFAPFIPNLCEEFLSVWDFWLGAIDSLVRGFLLQFPSHPLSFSPSPLFFQHFSIHFTPRFAIWDHTTLLAGGCSWPYISLEQSTVYLGWLSVFAVSYFLFPWDCFWGRG